MECQWPLAESSILQELLSKEDAGVHQDTEASQSSRKFSIALPLDSAVRILKSAAKIDFDFLKPEEAGQDDSEFRGALKRVSREDLKMLWTESADDIDLTTYCHDVVKDTVSNQARSALDVLCTSLGALLDLDELPPDLTKIDETTNPTMDSSDQQASTRLSGSFIAMVQKTECLKAIVKGLLFGSCVESVQQDSTTCAKGVFLYFLGVLTSLREHVIRIDANGSRLSEDGPTKASLSNELGSLSPFGYFELTSPFDMLNPFVLCEALAEMLSEPTRAIQSHVLKFFEEVLRESIALAESPSNGIDIDATNSAQLAFYETLLEALCRFAVTKSWNTVSGLRSAILKMIDLLGSRWAKQYEVELIHAAISSVKNAGKEIPYAGVKAFQFFVSIFVALYGKPANWDSITFVPDVLAIDKDKEILKGDDPTVLSMPSDAVLNLLIIELASTKQLVR